jgi:hypothetical protein
MELTPRAGRVTAVARSDAWRACGRGQHCLARCAQSVGRSHGRETSGAEIVRRLAHAAVPCGHDERNSLTRAVPPHNAPRALRISESPRLDRPSHLVPCQVVVHVHACADVRVQFGTDTSQAERLALERAQRAANYAQECSTRTEGLPHAFALGSTAGSPAPSRRNSIAQPRARAAAR